MTEEYFEAHGSSKVLTSDRTLQRLHTPKLDRVCKLCVAPTVEGLVVSTGQAEFTSVPGHPEPPFRRPTFELFQGAPAAAGPTQEALQQVDVAVRVSLAAFLYLLTALRRSRSCACFQVGLQRSGLRTGQQEGFARTLQGVSSVAGGSSRGQRVLPFRHS